MDFLHATIQLWLALLILVVILISVFLALAFGYRMGQGKPMVKPLPQMVRSIVGQGKPRHDSDADPIGDEQMTLESVRAELRGLTPGISTVKGE